MSGISSMTDETVRRDLNRAGNCGGIGTADERAAGCILSLLETLRNRLRMPNHLEGWYLEEDERHSALPVDAYRLVQRVVDNPHILPEAEEELDVLIRGFEDNFAAMNIVPFRY